MPSKSFLFRHKTIRRFATAGFEFKNFELRVEGEDERQRFLDIVNDLPPRDSLQIVEVNEEARAATETPVGKASTTAVRGPMAAEDILTGKDRQAISDSNKTSATPGANNLAPAPGKPQGFTGLQGMTLNK